MEWMENTEIAEIVFTNKLLAKLNEQLKQKLWSTETFFNTLLQKHFKPGLIKSRFPALEWFRDELAEWFCKKPNQFAFVSIGHYVKFWQKSRQNRVKIFYVLDFT